MDINTGPPPVIVNNYSSQSSVVSSAEGANSKPIAMVKPEAANSKPIAMVKPEAVKDQMKSNKDVNELTNDEISQITDRLNKFMEKIDTDLRFELHDKTNRVMVQVVDSKDQRVIKEFPPHELLDTLAAISDYVGVLLDKKA
ncbi:MAG: flagellar protein FlaG [Desulfitobacteriaceae bacterium]